MGEIPLNFKIVKNLKEELQEIVDKQKLTKGMPYICNHLCNINQFSQYKKMARKYAKDCYYSDGIAWWYNSDIDYVLSEKYRFIKDLIKKL